MILILGWSNTVAAQDLPTTLAQNLVEDVPKPNVVLGYRISELPQLPNTKPDNATGEWAKRLAQIADIPQVAVQQHSDRLFVNTSRANHLTIKRVLERIKSHGFEHIELECKFLTVKGEFEVKADSGKQLFPLSVEDHVFSAKPRPSRLLGESRTVRHSSFQKLMSADETALLLGAAEESSAVRTEMLPTVVTVSGMTAGISCGGELPLVVGLKIDGDTIQPRVALHQFGIKTDCTALVLPNGEMLLRLSVNQQDRPKVTTRTIGKFNGQDVSIQVPEVHQDLVCATCTMKPGQSLLLGGPVSAKAVPRKPFGIELASFGTEWRTEQMWIVVTARVR